MADDLERALTSPPTRLPEQSLWEFKLAPPQPPAPVYIPPPPPQSIIPPESSQPLYHVEAPPPPPIIRHLQPEPEVAAGLGRWLGLMAFGIIALVVLVGVIWLLTRPSADQTTDNLNPDSPSFPTIAPSETPANCPIIQIVNPVGNIGMSLGDSLEIDFSAAGVNGITRVDLQRFGQTLESQIGGGQATFQGRFTYTPDSTGVHEISLIPWSGDISGEAVILLVSVQ